MPVKAGERILLATYCMFLFVFLYFSQKLHLVQFCISDAPVVQILMHDLTSQSLSWNSPAITIKYNVAPELPRQSGS